MSSSRPMTVAFDIEGTMTRHLAFFALVSQALLQAGHRVIIITFRDDPQATAAELQEWGIAYSELVCWSEHEQDESADVEGWKGAVCRQRGVEIFFEDDPEVLACVNPETVCFRPFAPATGAEDSSFPAS